MNTYKKGWLYAISSDTYAPSGIYKLGYTEKPGLLEDEVNRSLIQRYGTTLVNPVVISLIPVAHPKQAETAVFLRLKDYRIQKELFQADFETIIKPVLVWAQNEFNINEPYEIREEILSKLVTRLRKKEKKYVNDYQLSTETGFWLQSKYGNLSSYNQNIVQMLIQLPHPCRMHSNIEWFKMPENQQILGRRQGDFRFVCNERNWDRKDPNLHGFLKELLNRL